MPRRAANRKRWWSVPGRHTSWPYLLLAGVVLSGLMGLVWPYNPAAWNIAGQLFPRPQPQAVLVDIDPASLADYGPPSTWPPELYKSAAEQLRQAGARAIGLDILLDPSRPDRAELNRVFAKEGVVLAALPDEPLAPVGEQSLTGVSALDRDPLGRVYAFRAAYRTADGELLPTLAWRLAHAAGADVPLDTHSRFLHHFSPSVLDSRISFRDVVRGNFRYAAVQDKVVVIGQASATPAQPVGGDLQVRAVDSLIAPPYLSFPTWMVALMAALITGLSFILGRSWGLVLALLMPLLTLLLWKAGLTFPGVTLAMAALIGLSLAGLEYLLARRGARLHTTLSEQMLGSRAGLSQAVEALLTAPGADPACLFLIRLEGYGLLEERFGQAWAEEAVDQGLRRLSELKLQVPNLEGCGFRWDRDELAFIVDPAGVAAEDIAAYFAYTLATVTLRGQSLQPAAGYAYVQALPGVPTGEVTAQKLTEAARQNLKPAPTTWN